MPQRGGGHHRRGTTAGRSGRASRPWSSAREPAASAATTRPGPKERLRGVDSPTPFRMPLFAWRAKWCQPLSCCSPRRAPTTSASPRHWTNVRGQPRRCAATVPPSSRQASTAARPTEPVAVTGAATRSQRSPAATFSTERTAPLVSTPPCTCSARGACPASPRGARPAPAGRPRRGCCGCRRARCRRRIRSTRGR